MDAVLLLSSYVQVQRDAQGVPRVYSIPEDGTGVASVAPEDNLLRVVYDHGPVAVSPWDDFSTVRQRSKTEWAAMEAHKRADPLTAEVMDKIKAIRAEHC